MWGFFIYLFDLFLKQVVPVLPLLPPLPLPSLVKPVVLSGIPVTNFYCFASAMISFIKVWLGYFYSRKRVGFPPFSFC